MPQLTFRYRGFAVQAKVNRKTFEFLGADQSRVVERSASAIEFASDLRLAPGDSVLWRDGFRYRVAEVDFMMGRAGPMEEIEAHIVIERKCFDDDGATADSSFLDRVREGGFPENVAKSAERQEELHEIEGRWPWRLRSREWFEGDRFSETCPEE